MATKTTAKGKPKAPAKRKPAAAKKYGARADLGASIDGYLAKQGGENRAICDALVPIVTAAVPAARAELKWGMPVFATPAGILCYMRAAKGYVRFGFTQGARLDDPDGVLEGSGDSKHVKIASVKAIDKARLTSWIKACRKVLGA